MNPIAIATILVAVIGLVGAVLLVVASKVFAVTVDERIHEAEMVLPGANCGGCGYAGCSAYAKAVVEGAPVNQCVAGGAAVTEKLALVMGVEADAATEYKAMIACLGDDSHTHKRYEYHGIPTCAACNVLYNGDSSCPFGCLGFGDCAQVCEHDAIRIENGVAKVLPALCGACGQCADVCPNHLISVKPAAKKVDVLCSSAANGKATKLACKNGCIGCKMCEKKCPSGAITVQDFHALIDYDKCTCCGACAAACPVKAIHFAGSDNSQQ